MGLDIYVGSYTRYFSRDWETIVQQSARLAGQEVVIARPGDADTEDAVADPDEIRPAVIAWRAALSESLGDTIGGPLDWDESPESPYFTDKPAWDCWGSLMLWAAYSEHPDIVRPTDFIDQWSTDPAFVASTDPGVESAYPALILGAEVWLPGAFRAVFDAQDLTGQELRFAPLERLRDELARLNNETWKATDDQLVTWRRAGAEFQAPMETGARFAFGLLWGLTNDAITHRLPMRLDY
jgi:hypothetical protein